MDIFERKELLRAKAKHQKVNDTTQANKKQGKQQQESLPLKGNNDFLLNCNFKQEAKEIRQRNAQICRSFELERAGRTVNADLFEAEAELFKKMRYSVEERFARLRQEFWNLCDRHLDQPPQLASDYVLARCFKNLCILYDFEPILGNKEIENEFYQFKEVFNSRAKKEDTKKNFLDLVKQIHTLRENILSSQQKKDFFERQGFQYNEKTFDSLFIDKFTDILEISTESSEEDEDENPITENSILKIQNSIPGSSSDQINSSQITERNIQQNSFFETDNSHEQSTLISQQDEDALIALDLENIEPHKFNWFKYLIDRYLKPFDEDGNESALRSPDSFINLLNILQSQKRDEEIQEELLDLVGFHNFELLEQLMSKRDAIKVYTNTLSDQIKEEKTGHGQAAYRGKNMNSGPVNSVGVTVIRGTNKKGKRGDKNLASQYETQKVSNYDLLKRLGFDEGLIEQNKKLGLKEKQASSSIRQYLTELKEGDRVVIQGSGGVSKTQNLFERKSELVNYKIIEEDTNDWKYISIEPPPKKEAAKGDLISIESMPKFCHQAFGYTKNLNQIQSIVYPVALKTSRSMIVAAPTGAGKTNVALLTILRQCSEHIDINSQGPWDLSNKQFQIVYIAPLKALAAEIVDKFEKALSYLKLKVRELTGDMNVSKQEIGETHIIVATPEKWDVVTRKTDGMMDRVNCLIIDEIHLLNDERGLVIECLVARALTTGLKNQKPIRIVGLSATLPNYQDVAEFIGADPVGTFYFDQSYRPTPLKCGFYGVKEVTNVKRANNIMNDIIYQNVKRMLKMGKQVIIFAHKRAETYTTALELIEILKEKSNDRQLFECDDSWKAKREVDKSQNQQVKDLFEFGFSVHHAGMLRKDRNLVEMLFNQGHIKVLCSTATLAWGVNLPAYGVIIKGTKVYDSNAGGYKDIGIFDVQQIFGRAGRPQFDTEGEGIIITSHKQVDDYVRMMSNKQTVESNLARGLDNCLNAEISAGTITTITEGVQWLKKTFFFQRVKKNPVAYGVKYDEIAMDPTGHMILLEQVTKSIERLNRMQLIRYNMQTEGLFPTDMGRIACNYYINCQTMSYFMANLQTNQRESLFLYHLAQASEFRQLEARKDEMEELKYLVQDIRFVEIDKASYNEAHTKVLLLLECYLRKITIKTFSLISDMAYVAQNVARLLRAMFEICMHRNYANLAKIALNWCKIVDRRLKPGDHAMKQFCMDSWYGKLTNASDKVTQFGYLKDEIAYRLQQFNISLDMIAEKDLQEAKRYLPPDFQDQLYKFYSHIPFFEIEITCQPITRSILKIQCQIFPSFDWSDRWNGKSEPFWIMIDNDQEILHSEFFMIHKKDIGKKGQKTLKNEEGISLTFFVPYEVKEGQNRIGAGEQYGLTILSDRWYDISYYKCIYLSDLDVPEEDFPNTKLLPLRPVSVKMLQDDKFEALYQEKFKFFNPVQSQVFHTLFHTDSNVLIGAPTGSGKTIMSELAMLRVFKNQPNSKIIFIAPLKALAKERIIDWRRRLQQGSLQKIVLELTGDVTPDLKALQKADVLITTPEKWDGISRNWQHRSYVSEVALVIIDEIHLLGAERGPVIEVIVSRMRYISEQTGNNVRFVGLSTALANAKDVADWMGIHKLGLYNFKPSVRPVPIKVFFEGFSEKHYCPRMATMNRPAYKAIMTHSRENPVLIFVSSRRQTRLTALDLIAMCAADQQESLANASDYAQFEFKKPFLHMDPEEIAQLSEFIKDENLRHTIQFGVGMHHAGLTESDRKIVEDLFVKKQIQVLVTTSTLAWGVNFPARLVIVKGTEFFDANLKRYVDFPLTDLLQMIGRAGRPQFDDCGIACVFVSEEKKNFYKKFLYEPFPVESSLAGQITDHLNAEIASGTLTKLSHCIDYLTWTYFFRRLTKNPAFYGLQTTGDKKTKAAEQINQFLKQLIMRSIEKLQRAGCIEYNKDEQSLLTTTLGYLASFYYLSHETITQLGEKVNEKSCIPELIEILSKAKEFAGLPVRHNEDVLNEALTHLVPFKVSNHELESPHVKAHLLLQAHFERCPLPITDYITDTKAVLDQSIRIIQGMIDISSHKGYLQTTMNLVHLIQMIIQGQWLDQSPFLNIPGFGDGEIIRKLSQLGILYLPQLVQYCSGDIKDFFDREVRHRLPYEDLKQITKALQKVPIVQVQYTVVKTNDDDALLPNELLEEGQVAIFMLNLKRLNKSPKQLVTISNFPKAKECTWFLLISESESKQLLAMKRISFKRFANKKVSIVLPCNFDKEKLVIHLINDSYIGMDQYYEVDLNLVNKAIQDYRQNQEVQQNIEDYGSEDYPEEKPQETPIKQAGDSRFANGLFSRGFTYFDKLQNEIIDDVVSDDGIARVDKAGGDGEVYDKIKMRIDMLLDSDEEYDQNLEVPELDTALAEQDW